MIQNLKSSTEKNIILLKKRALYYLGKREYSRLELHKKIKAFSQELELETQDIKAILNDLEGNNWLSDQRFTEQFILSKKNKYGVEKIRYELKVRGVADTIINTELVKIKTENYSLAKKIWAKKFDGAPKSLEERNKQIRFLQGRGIDIELIHQILSGKSFEQL
jgi:regulatory protein